VPTPPHPDDLVLTPAQAVPPPEHPSRGPAPEAATSDGQASAGQKSAQPGLDPALLRDIRRLADRAGGLQRLKEVIEGLILLRC